MVWVPGQYETVQKRVWVRTTWERVWVEPVYELRSPSSCTTVRVLVRAGAWTRVEVPTHFELRSARVWRPGHWISARRAWS